MENQQPKEDNLGTILLPIGLLFLSVSLTVLKDNPTLKMISLGASIIILLISVYLNAKKTSTKK